MEKTEKTMGDCIGWDNGQDDPEHPVLLGKKKLTVNAIVPNYIRCKS